MNLNNVKLALTAGLVSQMPGGVDLSLPQVALCGRSNVGKSSLINRLLGRKSLARVSAEPGKTVTVNFYEVDGSLYLVDLPGYGYARRSFDERNKWKTLIDRYFSLDAQVLFLQLVDLKVGATKDDEAMLNFLTESGVPFAVVATKSDKPNKTDREKNLAALRSAPFIPDDAEILPFSAQTGEGKNELWRLIEDYADFVRKNRT